MKKYFFSITIAMFMILYGYAQQNGSALAKEAGKALTAYNIDPFKNSNKLDEAIKLIEQALKTQDAQALASAWLTKGDIYNVRLQRDIVIRNFDADADFTDENDALVAFWAYKKGFNMADKKYDKANALKGIGEVQASLIDIGVDKYQNQAYENAFLFFQTALESHDLLKSNDQKSQLDNPGQLEEMLYFTGTIAIQVKRYNDALGYLNKLYRTGAAKPAVYESLFKCKQQMGDAAGAARLLTEGRKKYPDDSGLLFAEINEYLKAGKYNELTDRLKEAIVKEPGNISLYVTLGNVYDNLLQAEQTKKNKKIAIEYFEEAKKYYSQALAKEPGNLDAAYSAGALYYNKAANITQEMNAIDDLSSAGVKKYESLKGEVMELFDQALPYFKKAESINPNDINTLIALTEIFARKDDLKTSSEMKKRLEKVKAGGNNQSSYFR